MWIWIWMWVQMRMCMWVQMWIWIWAWEIPSMGGFVSSGGGRTPVAPQRPEGDSASRTESPSRLKATTKIRIATPGMSMYVMSDR